jgi:RNA polymerase sigma-70 factor (ECF subfamily)
MRRLHPSRSRAAEAPGLTVVPEPVSAEAYLVAASRGDDNAFARLYDLLAPAVFGVVRRVVRDSSQSEEVTQEIFVEVWRSAGRYEADRGSARAWVLTIAHRRAVDRVRAAQAATDRELRATINQPDREYDQVAEEVADRLDRARVQNCLKALTALQRESILLAYYGGHTHREVAAKLASPVGTVKTRLRDGLIRLRDCLGVTA